MSAGDVRVPVPWGLLVRVLRDGWMAAGLVEEVALRAAEVEAGALAASGRATLPGGAMVALDRLDAAVEALAAERDEWRTRVMRAIYELDEAPDINPDKAGKQAVRAVVLANTRAWAVLTEGRDPPSRRRAEDAPRDAGDEG